MWLRLKDLSEFEWLQLQRRTMLLLGLTMVALRIRPGEGMVVIHRIRCRYLLPDDYSVQFTQVSS